MLDRKNMLSLSYLSYGGKLTGDHKGMRYFMVMEKKEYEEDGEVKKKKSIGAYVWPEPFSFEKTPKEKITGKEFEFSEEGRQKAIDWITEQYETRKEEWSNIPNLTEIKK